MTARTLVGSGLCAVLVPLLSALPPAPPFVTGSSPVLEIEAAPPAAQDAADLPVRSTRLERRDAAAAGLAPTIAGIGRADRGTHWIAWTVPARSSGKDGDWGSGDVGRCVLDDDGEIRNQSGTSGRTEHLLLLARSDAGRLTRVAFADARCTVEAGSKTVYWLTGVAPSDSVALLAGLVRDGAASGERRERPGNQALVALALHDEPSATAALDDFVQPGQPREIRRDAAFWLGAARGSEGATIVQRLARGDRDDDFREHMTFVLTLIGEPGITTLVELAKSDASAKVRGQALFWLGQKAGQRASAALDRAVADDPDREVRKKAVFALSQLPKDEGVPKLIAVARSHRDPEVRKQAMFWLGQSGDDRALKFFEEVLRN